MAIANPSSLCRTEALRHISERARAAWADSPNQGEAFCHDLAEAEAGIGAALGDQEEEAEAGIGAALGDQEEDWHAAGAPACAMRPCASRRQSHRPRN